MKWFEKLKFARKVKGMTLDEVESATIISRSYISEIESGKIKDPSYFKMCELLRIYNLGIEDLEDNESEE